MRKAVFICYSMIARLCLRQQFSIFSAFVGNRDSCRNLTDRKTRKSDALHAIPTYLCHVERNERVSGGINKRNINNKKNTIMKKSKIYFAALLCMTMQAVSTFAQDVTVPTTQLPEAAKAFVQNYFPGQVIDYAVYDSDFDGDAYEACLNNGVEIDFDLAGNWEMVDCNYNAVPYGIVPLAISNFVDAHYGSTDIVKIDKEHYGYEVQLSNDIELKFTADGQLLAYDD